MAFTSGAFIVLILSALFVYYVAPKKLQWIVLLLANAVFYMEGGTKTVGYLVFTILTTWGAGLILGSLLRKRNALSKEERDTLGKGIRGKMRLTVAVSLILNFGMLYMLKYWDFTAESIGLSPLGLVLPLGVSFYIFQSVGYVIDCYRGKTEPEKNPAKFTLFVSFFPLMVQGPISRYGQLAPQLMAERKFEAENLQYGIQLALWGYFKKMVIADRAAILVNTVFGDYTSYSGVTTAIAVFFYCIELYCDFSGGIDITRGVAKMFGIDLVENFRRPIFATSLSDYWRRWHISLGQWMKDYIFYPISLSKPFARLGRFTRRKIGGKLGKIIPTSLATFIIYFIIGIWHGANFRYVFYGFWNGAIITASLLLAGPFERAKSSLRIKDDSRGWQLFSMARTWAIVFIGRYITRAPRLMTAFHMMAYTLLNIGLGSLLDGTLLTLGLTATDILVVLLGMVVVLIIEYIQEKGTRVRETLAQKHWAVQTAALFALMLAVLLFGIMRGSYISSSFIYQQY